MNRRPSNLKSIWHLLPFIFVLTSCQTETSNAPDGFQIHPDFKLELVASEPLVFDPVDMQFDEHGRTFVLEMPGYPFSDAESRLVELTDTDNDGLYDRRNIMDEKLGVATSFMPYKNGFLVAAPPNLLWISDSNDDGKIDKKEKIMGGFAEGNLQHNFNGLTYGIDNWIYAANGGNSARPFFESRPDSILDLRGTDFRFHLEKEEITRVGESSGGFKITFDDWGNLFETHNLEHCSHLVFEDRYLEDIPTSPSHALMNISDHEENGTSRIYPIGEQETRVNHPEQSGYFSGACGITHYGGGAFSEIVNGNLFVADCVLNLIHLDVLEENGSTFKTSRLNEKKEFLASKDRAFRPVNMSVGPDGSLYVLDMHRKVIEHPEWIPDELEANMDIDAGKDKGRIYRITRKENWSPTKFDLAPEDSQSLVLALNSNNQWKRMTAQRLLVTEERIDAVPKLQEMVENSEKPLARLHALWTLEGLGKLGSPLLKQALDDKEDGIRYNALKMAEKRLNDQPDVAKNLTTLLDDSSPRVRMQASLALSTLNKNEYEQMADNIANAVSKVLSKNEEDVWVIRAMASALRRQSKSFSESLLTKTEGFKKGHIELLAILAEKIGQDESIHSITSLLGMAHKNELPETIKIMFVEALAKGAKKRPKDEKRFPEISPLAQTLSKLESAADIELIRTTGELRKTLDLPISSRIKELMAAASNSVLDGKLPVEKRVAQLRLLRLGNFKDQSELLYLLLDNTQPVTLQQEALSQLKEAKDPEVGKRLLELWPKLGPNARKEATDILLYQSHNHDALLTAMESNKVNLGEFNLDLERRRTLLFWSDENTRKRAKALFSDAGVVNRSDAIEKMRPALALKGNNVSGKRVFELQCAQCHRYGNLGKDVGPVLTEVNRKSKESLLYDILDPNAAVDTKYLNHQVKTSDGTILTGLVFHETDTEIGIKMMGGEEKIVQKSNIEQFSSLGTSMMFEGLEANMSQQEMSDLLAFLQESEASR